MERAVGTGSGITFIIILSTSPLTLPLIMV